MPEMPNIKFVIEAALLVADEPLSINRLEQLIEGELDRNAIISAIDELKQEYEKRAFECVELASGYTIRVKQEYAHWVAKLWELKPARYSRAFLETLAIIAYKQPITRAEIEQIRGVAVNSTIIKNLLDREWVKIVGHRDVPGKPAVLATTQKFLDYFHLKNLEDLPDLKDIVDLDKVGDQLEMQLQQVLTENFSIEVNEEV